jgi:hypothetical protein
MRSRKSTIAIRLYRKGQSFSTWEHMQKKRRVYILVSPKGWPNGAEYQSTF